jgi:hypothetical protein
MRTTRESITFDHPFSLAAVDKLQPAGTYAVDIDEELIEGLSFLAYRRVATNHLPATPSRQPRLGPGHQGRSSGVDAGHQGRSSRVGGSPPGNAVRLRARSTARAENRTDCGTLSGMGTSTNTSAGLCWLHASGLSPVLYSEDHTDNGGYNVWL